MGNKLLPDIQNILAKKCLSADTKIRIWKNGHWDDSTLWDVRLNKHVIVQSINLDSMKTEKKKAVIAYAGKKDVYELTTESGKRIKASAGHKLYIKQKNKVFKEDIANLKKGDKLVCLQK